MMMATVHDATSVSSSQTTSKSSRVAKLNISTTSNDLALTNDTHPQTTLNKTSCIRRKTISIPSNHASAAHFTTSKLKKTNSLNSKKSDYLLNTSSKSYFGTRFAQQLTNGSSNYSQASDSEDMSSKLEVKSESLEETLVPILIVSSKNQLKAKYSDHFDQKTRAKYNNAQRIKKKQVSYNKITTAFSNTSTTTNNSNINSSISSSRSNINKFNDIQNASLNGSDQTQIKNKINHYINQPNNSLISVESSAKQEQLIQQQAQPPQLQSKLSNYSEMDVSTPFADVKQISVQNKPLGGKKIQLQTTNAFSASKFGIEAKQIPPSAAVTKYTSISNGSLANAVATNQLTGNQISSINNLNTTHNTSNTNLASNLMRSFLTSSNNQVNNKNTNANNTTLNTQRSYFNHLNSSNNNSSNNLFNNDNDISTFSFVPPESVKTINHNTTLNNNNNHNVNNSLISNSSNFYGNNSLITASIQQNRHLNTNNTIISNHIKEKTNAQISNHNSNTNSNSNVDKASLRDSSKIYEKTNNLSNLRKENSIYVSTKENTSFSNVNSNANTNNTSTGNIIKTKSNQALLDANSITNSIYANSSNISIVSNHHHTSNVNNKSASKSTHRNVLSSKQINQQTPVQNHTPNKSDCLTSSEALQLYGDRLTDFEKQEINEYAEIWFLGLEAEKLHATNVKDYDDENGAYIKVNKDHIAYRYEILETLGKGSFGQVLKCFDHKKKEHVALKIIRSKKRFQQQGMVEVNILQHLKNLDHDNLINVVHMKEYFYFRNHLCITFEILGINLYELIKKNNYQGFSIHLVRRFAYSILQCMRVMYRENIIHCDMKPENILLRQKGSSAIKVIDFGSGCFQSQRIYTYIQSRFYRAPEIILGIPYTTSIDMWSFGCILVELFTGYPIFPGENEAEQLAMIMEVIDLPPANVLAEASRRKLFFDSKNMPRNLNTKLFKKRRVGSRSLAQILKTTDTNFIDFVSRCLEWDPALRLNAEEAMKHPWILELKKKSSKEIRPKHRLRREAETSIEQDNTQMGSNYNDNTYNEYHFQKQMNLHNTIDIKDHELDGKKSVSNTFFPPLH